MTEKISCRKNSRTYWRRQKDTTHVRNLPWR
nr:MAG TPA: hypothetical protein [Caudoviricetes sp.]